MMKNSMKKDDRYYKTSDFPLACYLSYSGLELVGLDKTDPKRAIFSFRATPERELLVGDFLFSNPSVDVKKFLYTQKLLRTQLHNKYF